MVYPSSGGDRGSAAVQLLFDNAQSIIQAPKLVPSGELCNTPQDKRLEQAIKDFEVLLAPLKNSPSHALVKEVKIKALEIGAHLQNLLHRQKGEVNRTQYTCFLKWVEYTNVLCLHYYLLNEENGRIRMYINKLNELTSYDDAPKSLDEIFSKMTDSKDELNLKSMVKHSTVCFSQFAGRQTLIENLKNFCDMMVIQDRYKMLLLGGPPGTGKSDLAHAMMAHLKAESYVLNIPELLAKYVGETENTIKRLFKMLADPRNRQKKYVVFFDEADEIFKLNLRPELSSVAMAIQIALQGSEKLYNNVVVLAATNYKKSIRPTMLDRISEFIYVDVPEIIDILELLKAKCFLQATSSTIANKLTGDYWTNVIKPLCSQLPKYSTFRNLLNMYDIAKTASAIEGRKLNDSQYVFFAFQHENGDGKASVRLIHVQDLKTTCDSASITFPNSVYPVSDGANGTSDNVFVKCAQNNMDQLQGTLIFRPSLQQYTDTFAKIQFLGDDEYKHFLNLNGVNQSVKENEDIPNALLQFETKYLRNVILE